MSQDPQSVKEERRELHEVEQYIEEYFLAMEGRGFVPDMELLEERSVWETLTVTFPPGENKRTIIKTLESVVARFNVSIAKDRTIANTFIVLYEE